MAGSAWPVFSLQQILESVLGKGVITILTGFESPKESEYFTGFLKLVHLTE